MLQDAVRHPQSAHERILRRRDIEQPEITPAEIVRRCRRRIAPRLVLQALIGIERMAFALELLLVGELLARGGELVLRLEVRGIWSGRLGIGWRRSTAGDANVAEAAGVQ